MDDKKFAYFKTSTPEQWRFSIRVSPDRFLELTDVPGIKPSALHGALSLDYHRRSRGDAADYLLELIAWSYDKARFAQCQAARRARCRDVKQNALSSTRVCTMMDLLS
ncbi:hypothetical protein LP420_21645 [Massilia sp. B-10]|nr:hypothetical protein LP420_21645 [Massilia sp. B-10]